ncbi:Mrp/NBP35 family ATP-binding protein [Clostridium cellulovorans]|uniref:Iron-sulfur cluster carrier protein n=1 Tax=Clostridium cellulovorans (strain ATCC 35296 / DSM 3052 / OCM 3 / 743B) TaxID=573061 RepID=D9SPR1_CLOC7|nr:Mrp/NBP35 family ATP-binding protein [Clostridium cellulovorans]ADL50110.1 ATPase-like, ParA/MinD [Clostridium cellulovorans 743B]
MSTCDTCASSSSCKGKNNQESTCGKLMPKYGNIKNIIGVISGKGGVGKSTVTGILATKLKKAGYKVGVLDADITGPSMPRFFGINEKRATAFQDPETKAVVLNPIETELGIRVMSLNLLIDNEEDPVIWRGPAITGMLNQMYGDTQWGDLDYLLIDMPPGTGDVTLTVMQTIPVTSLVVVSTPQDMVSMIVKKVINMAQRLNISILGSVENMSYIICEKCGDKTRIFSNKDPIEHAETLGVKFLGELPIDTKLTDSLEQGTAEAYISEEPIYDEIYHGFLTAIKN